MRIDFSDFFKRARDSVLVPAIGSCLVVYFAYYAVFGERGLRNLMHIESETQKAETQLNELKTSTDLTRKKVEHLRPNAVDPDLLDERGRAVLNFTRPDEIVIMKDSKKPPQ